MRGILTITQTFSMDFSANMVTNSNEVDSESFKLAPQEGLAMQ
jgi:hypothetical protein